MSTYTIISGSNSANYHYCENPVSSTSGFSAVGSSPPDSGISNIYWSGDKWICVSITGELYYSESNLPTSWTKCTATAGSASLRPHSHYPGSVVLLRGGSIYLCGGWVGGYSEPIRPAISYSSDGKQWTHATSITNVFNNGQNSGAGFVTAIGYNGSYFLAGSCQEENSAGRASYTNLAYSSDGIEWTPVSTTFSNGDIRGKISSILWNGTNWLIGTTWMTDTLYISSGFSSPFTSITLTPVTCGNLKAIMGMEKHPTNNRIVAVGESAYPFTNSNMAYSDNNGQTWTPIPITSYNWNHLIWTGDLFVATGLRVRNGVPGETDYIFVGASSVDGITWQIMNATFPSQAYPGASIASSGYSGQAAPPSPPSAPTSLSVSGTQVSFTNSDTSVTNYQYSTNSGTTWTALSPVDAASPLDFSFLAGGTYSVLLKAVNSAGTSSSAGPVSVTIYTPPPAPTLSATGITIAVTAGASNGSTTTHYQWSTDVSAAWTTLSSTLTSSGSFTLIPSIAGLTPGAAQLIYVRAINSGLVNGVSASVSITIPTPAYTTPSVTLSGAISAGAVSSAVNVVTAGADTTLSAGALANTQVKSVNLAAATGITSIPEGTFSGCTSLAQVALPATLASISANSFNGCSSLSTISIPQSVTTIGANALAGTALTEITLTSGVDIGPYAFADCTEMTNATL